MESGIKGQGRRNLHVADDRTGPKCNPLRKVSIAAMVLDVLLQGFGECGASPFRGLICQWVNQLKMPFSMHMEVVLSLYWEIPVISCQYA